MLRFCVLLLSLAVVATAQLQIISTFKNTFLQNGTQGNDTEWSERTMTLRCSNNNFRDTGLQIGDLYWDVFCKPPKVSFETTLRMFVPYETRLYTAEVCMVPSKTTVVTPPLDPQQGQGRRRLLFWPVVAGFAVGFVVGQVACSHDVSLFGACGKKDYVPRAEWDKQLQADSYFKGNMSVWASDVNLALANQANLNSQINATLNNFADQLELLANNTATLQFGLNEVARISDERDANNTRKLHQIYDTIFLGMDTSIAYTDDKVTQLENITIENFRRTLLTMEDLSTNVTLNRQLLQRRLRNLYRIVRDQGANVARKFIGLQQRRLLSTQIHELAHEAQASGLKPFWNSQYMGSEPVTATQQAKTTFIEFLLINAINGTGTFAAHQWGVNLFCNVEYILDRVTLEVDWIEFMEIIGPINCTTFAGNKVDNCRCWVELTHKVCEPAATGNPVSATKDFNWQDITTQADISAYVLTNSKCKSNLAPVAGPWDGRVLDDIPTFHAFLSSLCGLEFAIETINSGERMWQMVGTRLGVLNFGQPPSRRGEICAMNTEVIFDTPADGLNVIFTLYRYWTLGFAVQLGDQIEFDKQRYGVLPNYLTYETHEFQTLGDNNTYTCYRASFTAVSEDTRPVYSVRPTGITPIVDATAYAEPPVCGTLGCTFGTPAVVTKTSDLTATIPFDFALPGASRPIGGEWRPSGMTTVFNHPESAMTISNALFDREGKITYPWQVIPDGYNISLVNYINDPINEFPHTTTLKEWQEINPLPFNHLKGGFSLKLTETPFSSTRCNVPAGFPVEWPCETLDKFTVDPTTDMRKGRLVLVPRDWSQQVTLRINEGEIVQRVFAGCPEFNFVTSSNDAVTELVLRNTLPIPVRAVVRIQYLSVDCDNPGDITYALQPRQETSRLLSACGQQIVSVFQITPGGSLKQCESSLNVTLDPLNAANIDRWINVITNRSLVVDQILAQNAQSNQAILQLLREIIPFVRTDVNTELTQTERNAAIDAILAAFNATFQANKQAALLPSTQSATEALIPMNQILNANNAQLVQLQANADVLLDNVSNLTARSIELQANLEVSTANLQTSIAESIAANEALRNALRNGENRPGDPCSWCNDRLGFIAKFICPLICPIVNFFISVGQIILYILIGGLLLAICFPAARAFLPMFLKWLGYVFTCGPCKGFSSPVSMTAAPTPLTGDRVKDLNTLQTHITSLQRQLDELRAAKPTVSGHYLGQTTELSRLVHGYSIDDGPDEL